MFLNILQGTARNSARQGLRNPDVGKENVSSLLFIPCLEIGDVFLMFKCIKIDPQPRSGIIYSGGFLRWYQEYGGRGDS